MVWRYHAPRTAKEADPKRMLYIVRGLGASKMNFTIDAMCCWMKIIVDYVYPSWFMYLPY